MNLVSQLMYSCTSYKLYLLNYTEKSKEDEDQVKKIIQARNALTRKINELGTFT